MKSHFTYTKQQRNGIFLLVILIITFQCIYFFVDFSSEKNKVNQEALSKFEKEIDSLRIAKLKESKSKVFPFNPNYITDYKGSTLGMTNEEIDRLLAFRKQGKWINSTKQFQEVTKVSDSLLDEISPYFKFPEWVNSPKPKYSNQNYNGKPKTFNQKQDLNTATVEQLVKVNGLGKVLSERIVKFRNKFKGGFIADVQLQDVYGLTPEIIKKITERFTVKTPRQIQRINLNTAKVEDLVTIQHIDYDLAYRIIEQRQLKEKFKSLNELTKVKGFPVNKIEIIELYLLIEKEIVDE
ncbi:helix-hairpin-helix domain-containing protein [Flaviramulus sp. BrNp1-15]|uniref:ComEA family DNA-binding protein n=1 Tax=Flaviramulus sp. BrNp1-15 TaxID=2916754 RepID=UPI001EE888FE|nr:helix-hairpin-helix domain-containing protein [Flaviramulus sp. BrNp1-15]ULC58973.1 helix-hairpin-helix domain-containing protein [Flaviramulus sp. BrNp1-15]